MSRRARKRVQRRLSPRTVSRLVSGTTWDLDGGGTGDPFLYYSGGYLDSTNYYVGVSGEGGLKTAPWSAAVIYRWDGVAEDQAVSAIAGTGDPNGAANAGGGFSWVSPDQIAGFARVTGTTLQSPVSAATSGKDYIAIATMESGAAPRLRLYVQGVEVGSGTLGAAVYAPGTTKPFFGIRDGDKLGDAQHEIIAGHAQVDGLLNATQVAEWYNAMRAAADVTSPPAGTLTHLWSVKRVMKDLVSDNPWVPSVGTNGNLTRTGSITITKVVPNWG